MFYADVSTLEKTPARHKILREIADSPAGTFGRWRKWTSRRQRTTQYHYARNRVQITGATLAKMRELDNYGLFHTGKPVSPSMYAEAPMSLSELGRRTLAHWDGVVDLPYSMTLDGQTIEFTIDMPGRVRAPGLAPFDVQSADEARDTIRSAFARAHLQDDVYDDHGTRPLRSEC